MRKSDEDTQDTVTRDAYGTKRFFKSKVLEEPFDHRDQQQRTCDLMACGAKSRERSMLVGMNMHLNSHAENRGRA